MSYCRWSSENGWCDVYVYKSERGYEAHVAARRRVDLDKIPRVEWDGDVDELVRQHKIRQNYFAANDGDEYWKDIGLPHDGKSFCDSGPATCADRLEALRAAGYNVPKYAIDTLREEAAEIWDRKGQGAGS